MQNLNAERDMRNEIELGAWVPKRKADGVWTNDGGFVWVCSIDGVESFRTTSTDTATNWVLGAA